MALNYNFTEKEKGFIAKNTIITKRRFMDLIAAEYHSIDNVLNVTWNPYKFLGGGIHLYTTSLFKNGEKIFTCTESIEIKRKYGEAFLNINT